MRWVTIDEVRPGDRLGRPIYNDTGDVLLHRDVTLTDRYITALRSRGFNGLLVCDGVGDDIAPSEIVSDRVRDLARRHMSDLLRVVQVSSNAPSISRQSPISRTASAASPIIHQLSRDVERIVDEILTSDTLDGAISIKSYDNYTFEHSLEVTVVAVSLGKRLYLSESHLRQLALGSLLHDIGKLAVPMSILNKPGQLTPEEYEVVKRHPGIGLEIVRKIIPSDQVLARQVVWQHHERQDGLGYPRGLKGHNTLQRHVSHRYEAGRVTLAAEVAAVADVYSALSSDRPYRRALRQDEVIETLRDMSVTHLNQEVVERFLSLLPMYPTGSKVMIEAGELRGFTAIVVGVNPVSLDKPVVRLLTDANGHNVEPREIDTREHRTIALAPAKTSAPAPVEAGAFRNSSL